MAHSPAKPIRPKSRLYRKVDRFDVHLVDGHWIRDNLDPDFTNYGEPLYKHYIPHDEFWIDEVFASREEGEDDLEYFCRSALREFELLSRGVPYDKAHEKVDFAEVVREGKPVHVEKLNENGGVAVWLVNGRQVRRQHTGDYVEGTNWVANSDFVPDHEIWIDDTMRPSERPFIELHERTESNLMAIDGWNWPEAHLIATYYELIARRNPERLQPLLETAAETIWLFSDTEKRGVIERLKAVVGLGA